MFTYERIILHYSVKRHQKYLKFSYLTPRCAKHSPVCRPPPSFTPRSAGHRGVSTKVRLSSLPNVMHTAEFHYPVSCAPPNFIPSVLHNAKFHSPLCRTPRSVCDSFGFLTPWCPVPWCRTNNCLHYLMFLLISTLFKT